MFEAPTYTDSFSDFTAMLECAACDGDTECLQILQEQAEVMEGSADNPGERHAWGYARNSAFCYKQAVFHRLGGRIADAMRRETQAGRADDKLRAYMLAN